jgi:hypothetical protein
MLSSKETLGLMIKHYKNFNKATVLLDRINEGHLPTSSLTLPYTTE